MSDNLEIQGKITHILDEESGTSARGTWKKQSFVIETAGQYPKSVVIMLWGDKTDVLKRFAVGDTVKAGINIESREYNGRWYTDVKAWKVEAAGQGGGNAGDNYSDIPVDEPEYIDSTSDEDEILPF